MQFALVREARDHTRRPGGPPIHQGLHPGYVRRRAGAGLLGGTLEEVRGNRRESPPISIQERSLPALPTGIGGEARHSIQGRRGCAPDCGGTP